MAETDSFSSLLYLTTLRVIQPARVQDVLRSVPIVWGGALGDVSREAIYDIHDQFRLDELITPVKKGSYVLTAKGFEVADRLTKQRKLDNLRMFLMKRQRKSYRRTARRFE
ncbi:MAG: hypothetical protein V7704_22370 [Aurantimonas endophytica]|uniref:hypothetical protein n=1 Tax=Aurantimonas endophytica TaxID=1522175 RepID=UPI0030016E42